MQSLPHPIPDDLAELIARRFRAIGEPMRVRLLDLLRDGEPSVNALAERLGAGQQNVSKHLGVLADTGIVARRKEGNHVYYRDRRRGRLRPLRAGLRLAPVPALNPGRARRRPPAEL